MTDISIITASFYSHSNNLTSPKQRAVQGTHVASPTPAQRAPRLGLLCGKRDVLCQHLISGNCWVDFK